MKANFGSRIITSRTNFVADEENRVGQTWENPAWRESVCKTSLLLRISGSDSLCRRHWIHFPKLMLKITGPGPATTSIARRCRATWSPRSMMSAAVPRHRLSSGGAPGPWCPPDCEAAARPAPPGPGGLCHRLMTVADVS